MLTITTPRDDRRTHYIVETIFNDWFGLQARFELHDEGSVLLSCGEELQRIEIDNVGDLHEAFDKQLSTPPQEAESVDLGANAVREQNRVRIQGPILSAMFHVLAGTEESDAGKYDSRERFPASSSALVAAGYADVPFVDLWAETLWRLIAQVWPHLERPSRSAKLNITHDIDAPYKYAFKSPLGLTRMALVEVARRSGSPFFRSCRAWWSARKGDVSADPYNSFTWMMEQAEEVGMRCTFYIITGKTGGAIDGDYDAEHPVMMKLWSSIIDRGHRIGLHPSYNAFRSLQVLQREKSRLDMLMDRLGVGSPVSDVRMHYLRFDPVRTPTLLQAVGFARDSSLGFADRHGFRRGTSRPFRLWDLQNSRPLDLIERPLLIMDASLFAARYQQFGGEKAFAAFTTLTTWCKRMAGEMTILWHNNFYTEDWHFRVYQQCLQQWREPCRIK